MRRGGEHVNRSTAGPHGQGHSGERGNPAVREQSRFPPMTVTEEADA